MTTVQERRVVDAAHVARTTVPRSRGRRVDRSGRVVGVVGAATGVVSVAFGSPVAESESEVGLTAADALDAAEVPAELVAVTVKV